ncbi:DUF2796 domain-containing protein [Zobellella endophytica]|uniref:DUF2796 domain-containing protein n=1 Tax=Zobellella endophytica TaxID=2116700 RepID=A0A2P7RCL5_9GAMM|nr:DUF2796 domain-containing protein [Zobellella endophytica]PSJ47961.1 DUF2796 domain-containing protein [Zobellella endophytica]
MTLKLLALTTAMLPVLTSAQTQLGMHEHGFGMLNLVLEQNELLLELTAPAADIVGFEHRAGTEAEQAQREAALEQLRQANALFTLTPAAACRLEKVDLAGDGHDHHDDHNHHDDHDHRHDDEPQGHEHEHEHDDHDHSDILVHYFYHCDRPDALSRIEVALFERFPSFHRIEVQGILPSGQLADTLTPEQPQIDW